MNRLRNGKGNPEAVSSSPFLTRFVEEHGGKIMGVYGIVMTIPHMFNFHTKRRHEFIVDLYVIQGRR